MASLTTIRTGDIVLVDKKGRRAHALVRSKQPRELEILPLEPGFTWTTVTSHEVVEHWRKTKNVRKTGHVTSD